MQLLDMPREQPGTARRNRRERLVQNSRESRRAEAEFVEGRRRAPGGPGSPGYQPVITVLSEGVQNTAMAVISGDRRYVRLTMQPMFTAITDVNTFTFFTGNANTGGPATGGTGTGTGTGR
jgi:hypothetical protein